MNRILISLFAGSVLLLAGCDEEKYQLKFSHYLHVTENEMDCSECHGDLGEASFNAITHETCIDCHDEPEADEVRMDTCGYCHQEKLLPKLDEWQAEPGPQRNIFVHSETMADQCQECHGAIFDENLATVPKLQRDDIVQIRDEAHASGEDCQACHINMDRYIEPASHDLAWMKRHGQLGIQTDAACSVCHSEDSCRECHSVMQPISHNNLWRSRTHGIEAAWDRASCMVCHEEDSCTSCHSQVKPRSHRGRWAAMGMSPTHCFGCHTDATPGEGCVVCHEEGNNVLLHQDSWPSFHDNFGNQRNCYDCHTY
jgi:hypothetical protein